MKVHHLSCGTVWAPGGHLPCHCLAIEVDDGVVLVDAGLGVPDVEGGRLPWNFRPVMGSTTVEQTAVRQLPGRGLETKRVKALLVTHLDLDHAGGLTDFPGVEVHVLKAELDAAHQPRSLIERRRYIPAQLQGVRFTTHEPTGTWCGLPATGALPGLPDGIRMVSLPGHSRGHAGIAVQQGGGWLLHCGDAWFVHEDLDGHGPFLIDAFQKVVATDRSAAAQTRRTLAELERKGEVALCNTHDPRGLPKA